MREWAYLLGLPSLPKNRNRRQIVAIILTCSPPKSRQHDSEASRRNPSPILVSSTPRGRWNGHRCSRDHWTVCHLRGHKAPPSASWELPVSGRWSSLTSNPDLPSSLTIFFHEPEMFFFVIHSYWGFELKIYCLFLRSTAKCLLLVSFQLNWNGNCIPTSNW